MGWGFSDKKAIASAKLSSMEKYGYTYQEDLYLIEEALEKEVKVARNDDGTAVVEWNNRPFTVKIRDFVPKKVTPKKSEEKKEDGDEKKEDGAEKKEDGDEKQDTEKEEDEEKKEAEEVKPAEEREGKWVSIWDVTNH